MLLFKIDNFGGGRLCNFSLQLPLSFSQNSRWISFFDIFVTIEKVKEKTTNVNFEKVKVEMKEKSYIIAPLNLKASRLNCFLTWVWFASRLLQFELFYVTNRLFKFKKN